MSDPSAPQLSKRREHAVALQYLEKEDLPKVIATGAGEIAREILQIAQEHQIPIEQDSTLTDLLAKVNVGSAISPDTFRLVAEVICFLYHTDLEFKKKHPELEGTIG